ncbi:MAG TPA: DUF547 domain-containing protein [Candidatus Polarisedimenticolaceae bacterium]|nr:DUF547 domain-containing protein [Candidatus Polarisedimenticolaceae bacterium]
MRAALYLAVLLTAAPPTGALDDYAALLSRYVTPQGVRYVAWRETPADVAALRAVVARLEAVDPAALEPPDRFATYINLYNAKVLQLVLEGVPRRSIRELDGQAGDVFSRPELNSGGHRLSLNALETRLREESRDPRVHFALNCAARSCPALAAEPYHGARLEAQLDAATGAFLRAPGAVVARGTSAEVSKIFDWYGRDFAAAGGVLAFLRRHGAAAGAVELRFQPYDWSLNQVP